MHTNRRGFFAALPAPLATLYLGASAVRPVSPHDAIRSAVRDYEGALAEERRVQALYPPFPEDESDDAQAGIVRAFEDGPLRIAQDAVWASWDRVKDRVHGLGCVALVCGGELYPFLTADDAQDVYRLDGGFKAGQILNLDAGKGGVR
jgi:hypothetical protein